MFLTQGWRDIPSNTIRALYIPLYTKFMELMKTGNSSLQRYPNHACEGINERNTNLTYYLRHENGQYVGPRSG